jgi:branched-chain amino acid transport system substrate-binding protein
MRNIGGLRYAAAAMLAVTLAGPAAAETVKVGLILPYSGPFAGLGAVMDNAIKLFVAKNGDTAGAHKIEIIRRDETGPNPDVAKRLAQELIARDGVQFVTGLVFTPNALAVAPLATESKTPTIIMNAATAMITRSSP